MHWSSTTSGTQIRGETGKLFRQRSKRRMRAFAVRHVESIHQGSDWALEPSATVLQIPGPHPTPTALIRPSATFSRVEKAVSTAALSRAWYKFAKPVSSLRIHDTRKPRLSRGKPGRKIKSSPRSTRAESPQPATFPNQNESALMTSPPLRVERAW